MTKQEWEALEVFLANESEARQKMKQQDTRRTLSILTMLSIALATWALMGRGLVVDKLGLYDLTAALTAMVSALLAFDKTLRKPMCHGIITGWLVACIIRPVRPLESLVIAFAVILCLTLWDLDHIMREGE